jgi:hypothetical protein
MYTVKRQVVTDMLFAIQTLITVTTWDMSLDSDFVPCFETCNISPNGNDVTTAFMAQNEWQLDTRALRPSIPRQNMKICSTKCGRFDFHQNFVRATLRDGYALNLGMIC